MRTRAYTYVELLVVLAILAALAVVAVPRFSFGFVDRSRAEACARTLVTDLRRTRSLALRDAALSPLGYALDLDGSPVRTYTIRSLAGGQAVTRQTLDADVTVQPLDGLRFAFGPYGQLAPGSASTVRIRGGGGSYRLQVTAATGQVQLQEEP